MRACNTTHTLSLSRPRATHVTHAMPPEAGTDTEPHHLLRHSCLNAASPRAQAPPGFGVELWAHQQALLWACRAVEEASARVGRGAVGALVDRPGAGKTHVVLALALSDAAATAGPTRRTTVVVAPLSVFSQWEACIRAVSSAAAAAGELRVASVRSYAPVARLVYAPEELLTYDLVLVTPLYYGSIARAAGAVPCGPNVRVHRLVFDEVDSISGLTSCPVPLGASATWYVSATADRVAAGVPLTSQAWWHGLPEGVACVACDPAFIDACLPLPEPRFVDLVFRDVHIDGVLAGLLPVGTLRALDAMAYDSVTHEAVVADVPSSAAEAVALLLRDSAARVEQAAERSEQLLALLERIALARASEDVIVQSPFDSAFPARAAGSGGARRGRGR
jgi:hypothetical protein